MKLNIFGKVIIERISLGHDISRVSRICRRSLTFTMVIFGFVWVLTSSLTLASTESFEVLVNELPSAKLKSTPPIIERLSKTGDERVLMLFEAMLEGNLYFVRSDKTVVRLVDGTEGGTPGVISVLVDKGVSPFVKAQVKKIRVNNKIRKLLRAKIADLKLFSSDYEERLAAVDELMGSLNDGNVELLQRALTTEKNSEVTSALRTALNIAALDSQDTQRRREAAKGLAGELHPAARNKLREVLEKNDDGNFVEQDSVLVRTALRSLKKIEGRLEFYAFLERVFFGLSLGSVLLLAAIGLSITFGVMGVINMAHGELLMLGAYTTYVIQQLLPNHIGASVLLAIPVAFLVCGAVGIGIERSVIRFLKGRPLETLLATFGLSLILQQTVRTVFSPLNRQVSSPEWMSGALQIAPGLSLTYNRLYILFFSLVIFVVLLLVIKRTRLGLYVRAVSQNRNMARALGIRSEWVDAMTFGLGSGIAGVAGVALSQLTNVGPNLGQSYIIDSFLVVVFGGVGNLWGTLVAAFSLGVFNKFLEPVVGTVLSQIFVLVFIVLFIQKRPKGLFPQRGRAADS